MDNVRRIRVTDIIANDAVEKGKRILALNGLSPAKNKQDLASKLSHLLKLQDDDVLTQIADAHPDKDFILNYSSDAIKSNATGAEVSTSSKNGHGDGCRCRSCMPSPYYNRFGSSQEYVDDYMLSADGETMIMRKATSSDSGNNQNSKPSDNIGVYGMGLMALALVVVVALATRK